MTHYVIHHDDSAGVRELRCWGFNYFMLKIQERKLLDRKDRSKADSRLYRERFNKK